MAKTIRILLVEDSPVQRELLAFILEEAGDFELIATAGNGQEAVEQTERLKPDIVLMDCHMPKMDGIEATRRIMAKCPTPIVIVSASLLPDDVQLTFDAIKSGALAVMSKPAGFSTPEHEQQAKEMVTTLRLMSDVKVVGRRTSLRTPGTPPLLPRLKQKPRAIAIAGSTGAPGIVSDILAAVGPSLPCPILIVQHMARGFVGGFATWLSQKTKIPVLLGQHGMMAEGGRVYVAPDDVHMGIAVDGRLFLSNEPAEDGFRPSASYLLRSVATAFGPSSVGILLTGMGRDGAAGLAEIRRAGGVTAVQDEASCVVFGMPREAIRLEAAMHVLSPPELAKLILNCTANLGIPSNGR
jgi:two-component system, chemotaxis family, protein-glutamate methylesterase/glutaminase